MLFYSKKFYSCHVVYSKPFPKQQILDSSKPKELPDHNSKFGENVRKFSKRVGKSLGKGEIALLYTLPQVNPFSCQKQLAIAHIHIV